MRRAWLWVIESRHPKRRRGRETWKAFAVIWPNSRDGSGNDLVTTSLEQYRAGSPTFAFRAVRYVRQEES